jgi:hypothetical protein
VTTVKLVVTRKSKALYILALRSNATRPGWKRRPRENAPRIFEIEEPTTLPKAREERSWRMDATTTAS